MTIIHWLAIAVSAWLSPRAIAWLENRPRRQDEDEIVRRWRGSLQ